MISRDELMHHRLQAWLRENKCDDLEYLGFYPDALRCTISIGIELPSMKLQLIVLKILN
jgi:hypothetical protein